MTFTYTWKHLFHCLLFFAALSVGGAALHAAEPGARVVKYSKEDIVPVHAKLRFSTLLVLPDDEEILDFTTGDREFWIINGSHNLCYVHPAQAGIRSNLNLITASGHVYSFLLTEISSDTAAQPDLKVFIEPKEGSAPGALLRGYPAGHGQYLDPATHRLVSRTVDHVRCFDFRPSQGASPYQSHFQRYSRW